MEIVIDGDEPISQTKKYENMFKPSNIKNWSKLVLDTCAIIGGTRMRDCENKIIIRGREALFEYFEELYKLGMSDMQNHDFILQIPTILYEYKDIIERISNFTYNEIMPNTQFKLHDKYIGYFKDLMNSPPPSFTEIAKLIDVCIKFSSDNFLDIDTFLDCMIVLLKMDVLVLYVLYNKLTETIYIQKLMIASIS